MTHRSNFEEHQRGIKLSSLSKTFQDAIKITQTLGIRYLWIDSLCIIQDDETDWMKEAERMGAVYEKAFCTIAAVEANNGSEGCFAQKVDYQCIVKLPCSESTASMGHVYLAKRVPIVVRHFDYGPLFTRAWTLQERILSRRVLHFAKDQVYWECREQLVGEDGNCPGGSPLNGLREKLFRTLAALHRSFVPTNIIGEPIRSHPQMRVVNFWTEIVTYYSTCKLTMPKDKVPALLGLASTLQEMTGLKHFYGLLFDNTVLALRSLLWHRHGAQMIPVYPTRAPSWSWASLDGAVSFHYTPDDNDDCTILDLNADVGFGAPGSRLLPVAELLQVPGVDKSENPLQQPLLLSAPLFKASLGKVATWGAPRGSTYLGWPAKCFTVRGSSLDERLEHVNRVCFDCEEYEASEFWLAPLFEHRSPSHRCCLPKERNIHRLCLVLADEGKGQAGVQSRRIGFAMVLSKTDSEVLI